MNDKLRFIVWTLLMVVLFPLTLMMFLIFWLSNDWDLMKKYVDFYFVAWRKH